MPSDLQTKIDSFLAGTPFAVVGASDNRAKYGNKVLRCYIQNHRVAIPVNPNLSEVEGLKAYPNLAAIPKLPHGVSIITPPSVTARVIEEASQLGIKHIWMQPGAETAAIIRRADELGINVIAGGPCLLVVLGYRDH